MFSYKIVLVGDFGTGKTSLVRRFVDNSFSEEYKSSIGVSISKKLLKQELNDEIYDSTMMIWDIEGKTEFKSIFSYHLVGAKAFIIVADLSRMDSINSIEEHIRLCEKTVVNAPIIIALNKCDLEHIDINLENIKNLSPNIINVLKTSAKEDKLVNDIFQILNLKIIEGTIK